MLQIATLDDDTISLPAESLEALRSSIRGEVICQDDTAYDLARGIFNGMIDRHPAMIIRCSGVADVMRAVRFAAEHRLLTAVRGGGHGIAGTAVCDGGLMINLERLNSVRVDPQAKIAWVGGGAALGDVDHETAAHGLACPGGVVSTTGVAGLTTGGGYGWLRGKLGMSIDNLRAVEIVTADGQFRRASEAENPDLFWAVRGGGGNFGIVTTFEFNLHPIEPEVMLCNPIYAAEHAREVLRGWRDFMATAPDELTTEFFFWTIPPMDHFPEELHGKDVVVPCAVYYGPPEEGEKVIQPLRELAPVLLDISAPMPFVEIQQMFDPYLPYGEVIGYWKALYMDRMNDDMADTLVDHFLDRPKNGRICPLVLHYLNGVSQRVPNDATAFPGRNWSYLMEYNLTWNDPADDESCIAWVRSAWNEMRDKYQQHGGAYLNIDSYSDDGLAWVKETFGDNFPRLQALKDQYDPMNLFRLNPNIPPSE
ncbi:FAD-binding oxidoreductase [Elongatibacter sediminis]|uniref:FAD-binding oxidoreductase n=1 Tax=Elongatibacter sediminis TaxID=3119006 RepID=A0AAW9RK57_9GAMM